MALFNRVVSVLVGSKHAEEALDITDLRVTFEVQKTCNCRTLNRASVEIYNLNPTQRAMIRNTGDSVIIQGGYDQDQGAQTIYTGGIVNVENVKQLPDVITRIESHDGMVDLSAARFCKSYKAGTGVKQVLQDVVSKIGLPSSMLGLDDVEDDVYDQGMCLDGQATEVLTKTSERLGVEWSVQNGELKVIKLGGVTTKTAYLLDVDHGMLGSPERVQNILRTGTGSKIQTGLSPIHVGIPGWSVRCLLLPSIEPGDSVTITSNEIPAGAKFRVEKVTHKGDTHADDWTTIIEVTNA